MKIIENRGRYGGSFLLTLYCIFVQFKMWFLRRILVTKLNKEHVKSVNIVTCDSGIVT